MYLTYKCNYNGTPVVIEIKGNSDHFEPVSGYTDDDYAIDLNDSQLNEIVSQEFDEISQEMYIAALDESEVQAERDLDYETAWSEAQYE